MFVGACRENHERVACGVDIRGEQEFEWTNFGNRTPYSIDAASRSIGR